MTSYWPSYSELTWEDGSEDSMAPSDAENLDHLDWFIDKMREKFSMRIGYCDYDDMELETDEQRERRINRERAEEAARIAAKFERMRRVAPKGTVFPAKLLKAKRRVVGE